MMDIRSLCLGSFGWIRYNCCLSQLWGLLRGYSSHMPPACGYFSECHAIFLNSCRGPVRNNELVVMKLNCWHFYFIFYICIVTKCSKIFQNKLFYIQGENIQFGLVFYQLFTCKRMLFFHSFLKVIATRKDVTACESICIHPLTKC